MQLHRYLIIPMFFFCAAFLAVQTVHAQSLCGAPQGLTAKADSPVMATISWRQGSGSTPKLYRIYKGSQRIASTSSTSYGVVNLSPSTTYQIKVTAVDSKEVESVAATTSLSMPSNVPKGVTVNPVGPGQVYVTWDYMAATEFKI